MPSPTRPAEALVDSNVIVAALAEENAVHAVSLRFLNEAHQGALAVAAHSFAEAYNTLTKHAGGAPYRRTPQQAWAGLQSIIAMTKPIGLTPVQTLEAVRRYAEAGGISARLYDHLIGEAAVQAGVRRIITWNVGHMRGLFPELEVLTPGEVVR